MSVFSWRTILSLNKILYLASLISFGHYALNFTNTHNNGLLLGSVLITEATIKTSSNNDAKAGPVSRTLWHVTPRRFLTTEYSKLAYSMFWSIKTDPILNNYLTQTMDNNARSGLRRAACLFLFGSGFQTEMSFIFVFPTILRIEKDLCCLLSYRSTYRLRKPIE